MDGRCELRKYIYGYEDVSTPVMKAKTDSLRLESLMFSTISVMKAIIDLTAASAYSGHAPHTRSRAETVEKTNWSGKAHSVECQGRTTPHTRHDTPSHERHRSKSMCGTSCKRSSSTGTRVSTCLTICSSGKFATSSPKAILQCALPPGCVLVVNIGTDIERALTINARSSALSPESSSLCFSSASWALD